MFKLLILFCAYLPFQIALNPFSGVDLASVRLFAVGLFLFWLAESFRKKTLKIKLGPAGFFVSLFLFLNLFSLLWAENSAWSIRKLLFVFSFWPLYVVFSSELDSEKKGEKIFRTLVFGGLLVALVAIVQFFAQFFWGLETVYRFWAENMVPLFLGNSFSQMVLENPSWLVEISGQTYLRAIAFAPDPHMLAFYLGLLIPLSLALYFKTRANWLFLSFVVMILADLLTFSRGGYLALFFGLACFVVFGEKNKARRYWLAMPILGLVFCAFLFFGPISQRFFSSFDLREGSNRGRLATWKEALEISLAKPFGVGIGNYPLEIKATASYREPIYAHSAYLDIAAETGILSLVAWLGLLLSSLARFFQRARENVLFFGAGISVIIFMVHSLVETPLYSVIVLPLFLIILTYGGQK